MELLSCIAEHENDMPDWISKEQLPNGYVNIDGLVTKDDSHSINEKIRPYPDQLEPERPPATTRRRIAGR